MTKSLLEQYLDCSYANLRLYNSTLHLLRTSSLTKALNFYYYDKSLHRTHFITNTGEIAPASQWVKAIQQSQNMLMKPNVYSSKPKFERQTRECAEKMFIAQAHSKATLYYFPAYNLGMMQSAPHFILVTKHFFAKRLSDNISIAMRELAENEKSIVDNKKSNTQQKHKRVTCDNDDSLMPF